MVKACELIPNFDQKCEQLMDNTKYGFTRRESEILILSCYDLDVDEIARLIHRSRFTVLKHRENARRKTQFNTLMKIATTIWPYIDNHELSTKL